MAIDGDGTVLELRTDSAELEAIRQDIADAWNPWHDNARQTAIGPARAQLRALISQTASPTEALQAQVLLGDLQLLDHVICEERLGCWIAQRCHGGPDDGVCLGALPPPSYGARRRLRG